ncbi:MAG TPA: hypothetical protein VKR83_02935, partial [Ktedonobacteraceae bacterium]|nr:hypothetical protein [Ktedonobacteraceae bacterium]
PLVQIKWERAAVWTSLLAIAISLVSFKSEAIAQRHGIHPLTILILILGLEQAMVVQAVLRPQRPGPTTAAARQEASL